MDCCNKEPARYIPGFWGFTEFTTSIPKIYWDVKSQEQRILGICKLIDKLVCYADMLGDEENESRAMILELQAQFQKFMESGFDDYYAEQIEKWVNDNLEILYKDLVKQVFFGLNEQGHFVAYIPESWDDIIFDTGAVYGIDTYGRLILRWDVDNSGDSVNQRPEDWS